MRSWLVALLVGFSALSLGGCARISSPTGGEPDQEPPQVIATEPEQYAVVPGWDRPVVIRFDERISEKGIRESVMVSPETGAVRVRKGRSELRVTVEGGWRPGQIYRVVVLPVVQDLFNNTRNEELELIFSTGPEIPATAAAGLLTDRLTGQPVEGARVEAINMADSARYVALSDTAGFFALRHIPAGEYSLLAYQDRNRSRRLDFGEPEARDELRLGAADTVVVSYALLAADTTPARVVRAEERDTLEIRITIDDHLDPEVPLDEVEVVILELPDSVPVPGARVMHLHAYERWRAEEVAPDSAEVVEPPGVESPLAEDEPELLPTREFVVVPQEPLARKTRYQVTISGLRNINGVGGGGGSVVFETAAAVVPDSVRVEPGDTTSVAPPPPDSAGGAPPDTTGWLPPRRLR